MDRPLNVCASAWWGVIQALSRACIGYDAVFETLFLDIAAGGTVRVLDVAAASVGVSYQGTFVAHQHARKVTAIAVFQDGRTPCTSA